MMKRSAAKRALALVSAGFAFIASMAAQGDTMSCPSGTQMKCLGYGDKVVGNNAVCFDPLECSQEGFVCKSELDGLAMQYEDLTGQHNGLVAKYNELVGVYDSTVAEYDRFAYCVSIAPSLEDAKACAPGS